MTFRKYYLGHKPIECSDLEEYKERLAYASFNTLKNTYKHIYKVERNWRDLSWMYLYTQIIRHYIDYENLDLFEEEIKQ